MKSPTVLAFLAKSFTHANKAKLETLNETLDSFTSSVESFRKREAKMKSEFLENEISKIKTLSLTAFEFEFVAIIEKTHKLIYSSFIHQDYN